MEHVFFRIDYTVNDELPDDVSYFHAQWRRTNGTAPLGEGHVILDGVTGARHYVGSSIGLTSLERYWWGRAK
jgi:hypothetical protein